MSRGKGNQIAVKNIIPKGVKNAEGVWDLQEQFLYRSEGMWPNNPQVSSVTANSTTTGNLEISVPAHDDGDLLFTVLLPPANTVLTEWNADIPPAFSNTLLTYIAGYPAFCIGYRVANSEPASYTFKANTFSSTFGFAGTMMCIKNANTTDFTANLSASPYIFGPIRSQPGFTSTVNLYRSTSSYGNTTNYRWSPQGTLFSIFWTSNNELDYTSYSPEYEEIINYKGSGRTLTILQRKTTVEGYESGADILYSTNTAAQSALYSGQTRIQIVGF